MEKLDSKNGSTNPFGKLIRVERYSQEEFDKRDLSNFYAFLMMRSMPLAVKTQWKEKTFVERFEV